MPVVNGNSATGVLLEPLRHLAFVHKNVSAVVNIFVTRPSPELAKICIAGFCAIVVLDLLRNHIEVGYAVLSLSQNIGEQSGAFGETSRLFGN